jgi:hypothetical protein
MKQKVLALACMFIGLFSGSTGAAATSPIGPSTFEGTVGAAKVVMLIDTRSWKGAYFYRSIGRDIPITGSAAQLNETDPSFWTNADTKVTAEFRGALTQNGSLYSGTWVAKKDNKQLPFSLKRTGNATVGRNVTAKVLVKTINVKANTPSGGPGREATYHLPEVSGLTPDWIGTRITGTLQAAALFDETLDQAIQEFKPNGFGITLVDYQVPFNAKGVLNVELQSETEAAYPDHHEQYKLFDLRNGAWLQASDLFRTSEKRKLVALLQKQLDVRIAVAEKDLGSDGLSKQQLGEAGGKSAVDDQTLAAITITKTGVVFHHEFGLAHAIEALEPDGTLALTWAELQPFRSPATPFAALG